MIDLGLWASESYRVAADEPPDDAPPDDAPPGEAKPRNPGS
jgi:endogenous inhibitor of DNA gyrase (YacG/DUF329 family)